MLCTTILLPDGAPARHEARDVYSTAIGVLRDLTDDFVTPAADLVVRYLPAPPERPGIRLPTPA